MQTDNFIPVSFVLDTFGYWNWKNNKLFRAKEKTFCVWQPQIEFVATDRKLHFAMKTSEKEIKVFNLVNPENLLNLFTVDVARRRLISVLQLNHKNKMIPIRI